MTSCLCWITIFFSALLARDVVYGARNFTVDNTDTISISYKGNWQQNSSPFAIRGSHAYSLDRLATATFSFTGVAIYYEAPMWAYTVDTLLTLDSGVPTVVNMTSSHTGTEGESEDTQSQILWWKSGLSNTQHTLTASMWANGMYVVMDALIYTILDPADIPLSPSSSNPSDASATVTQVTTPIPSETDTHSTALPTTASTTRSNSTLISTVGVVTALLILVFLFCRPIRKAIESQCRRRRKHFQSGLSSRTMSHDAASLKLPLPLPRTVSPEPSKSPCSSDTLARQTQPLHHISATAVSPLTTSNSECGSGPSVTGMPDKRHDLHQNVSDATDQQNEPASLTRTSSMLSDFSRSSRTSDDLVKLYHTWSLLYGHRPSTPPVVRTQDEIISEIASRRSEPASLNLSPSVHPSSVLSEYSQPSRHGQMIAHSRDNNYDSP